MAYEKDIKELIEQMQRQQSGYGMPQQPQSEDPQQPNGVPPISQRPPSDLMGGTDQSPHLVSGNSAGNSPDQSPINPVNSVRPMGPSIKTAPPKPKTISVADGGCPQCGTIHPPVPPGQKCPMAKVKVKNEKGEEKEIDVNKFLAQLKNIIVSQSEQKEIKDVEKLFKNIILEVTKYIEGYSE